MPLDPEAIETAAKWMSHGDGWPFDPRTQRAETYRRRFTNAMRGLAKDGWEIRRRDDAQKEAG
jgi:hypothetical protein